MMSELKCYFGGSRDISREFEFVAVCFAKNQKEARRLLWTDGELREHCEHEFFQLRVIRQKAFDHHQNGDSTGYLVTNIDTLRDMGWRYEGDEICEACDLYEQDGRFPVCIECYRCSECGHHEDCPTHNGGESE